MQQPSLNALTSIVEQIARTGDPRTVMSNIVQRLRELMQVEVCSLYLCTPDYQHLILAATEGLSAQAVGKAKLGLDEGLVGHIAASLSTLNLGDAPADDRFVFIPETHEMPYHRFLGVPLLHLRKLIGVLVIQGREREPFPSWPAPCHSCKARAAGMRNAAPVAATAASPASRAHRDWAWASSGWYDRTCRWIRSEPPAPPPPRPKRRPLPRPSPRSARSWNPAPVILASICPAICMRCSVSTR